MNNTNSNAETQKPKSIPKIDQLNTVSSIEPKCQSEPKKESVFALQIKEKENEKKNESTKVNEKENIKEQASLAIAQCKPRNTTEQQEKNAIPLEIHAEEIKKSLHKSQVKKEEIKEEHEEEKDTLNKDGSIQKTRQEEKDFEEIQKAPSKSRRKSCKKSHKRGASRKKSVRRIVENISGKRCSERIEDESYKVKPIAKVEAN